jgi:superfamily II RNA helicase
MGKTLIAEAGIYEVIKTGKKAYYTTPLIALTEQKYRAEISGVAKPPSNDALECLQHGKHYVGLVTDNRRENPDAPILVLVFSFVSCRIVTWALGTHKI